MVYKIISFTLFLFSLVYWDNSSQRVGAQFRINNYKKYYATIILICLLLILHDGLRWEIGTDWGSYYSFFIGTSDNQHIDMGYRLMTDIFHYISDNYTVFLICYAFFVYIVIYKLVCSYSPQPIASICLYYCGMLGMLGCNRQILALMFCIISLKYIFERNFLKFLICVIIALSFHKTSIIWLPTYFLVNCHYNSKTLLFVSVLCFFVGISGLINKIPYLGILNYIDDLSSTTSFAGYVADKEFAASLMGPLKRIFIILLALSVRKNINDSKYDFLVLLYVIGSCIFMCFNGSVIQLFAGRGTMYFNIFEIIIIPYIASFIRAPKQMKVVIYSCFFALAFYLMMRDINSYNVIAGEGYDIYNPYKCVLFL